MTPPSLGFKARSSTQRAGETREGMAKLRALRETASGEGRAADGGRRGGGRQRWRGFGTLGCNLQRMQAIKGKPGVALDEGREVQDALANRTIGVIVPVVVQRLKRVAAGGFKIRALADFLIGRRPGHFHAHRQQVRRFRATKGIRARRKACGICIGCSRLAGNVGMRMGMGVAGRAARSGGVQFRAAVQRRNRILTDKGQQRDQSGGAPWKDAATPNILAKSFHQRFPGTGRKRAAGAASEKSALIFSSAGSGAYSTCDINMRLRDSC